jgi:hypothetical protein
MALNAPSERIATRLLLDKPPPDLQPIADALMNAPGLFDIDEFAAYVWSGSPRYLWDAVTDIHHLPSAGVYWAEYRIPGISRTAFLESPQQLPFRHVGLLLAPQLPGSLVFRIVPEDQETVAAWQVTIIVGTSPIQGLVAEAVYPIDASGRILQKLCFSTAELNDELIDACHRFALPGLMFLDSIASAQTELTYDSRGLEYACVHRP